MQKTDGGAGENRTPKSPPNLLYLQDLTSDGIGLNCTDCRVPYNLVQKFVFAACFDRLTPTVSQFLQPLDWLIGGN